MPDLHDFLEGFGVRKGLKLKGWVLIKIDEQHNTILRYHQYEYPISCTFKATDQSNLNELLTAFKTLVQGTRIINSRWGNPYQCDFGDPKIKQIDSKTAIIETVGHSVRIYH